MAITSWPNIEDICLDMGILMSKARDSVSQKKL